MIKFYGKGNVGIPVFRKIVPVVGRLKMLKKDLMHSPVQIAEHFIFLRLYEKNLVQK